MCRTRLQRGLASANREIAGRSLKAGASLAAVLLPLVLRAQSLVITNGVQTYSSLTNTTVTMSNRCELRLTDPAAPIAGCLINLNSTDAFFVLANVLPSAVVASYLSQVRIDGAAAVADSNCRVVQYGPGAVIVPHPASFQPLQV